MKILLVNPTGGPDESYGSLAKAATELPQLGVASIAANLHANGHHARVIDFFMENMSLHKLIDIIKEDEYEMVGFSVYITTEKTTLYFAKEIKKVLAKVKVCVGGPQVTLAPDNYAKDFIDYVFLGEADFTLLDLIANIEKNNYYPQDIKGLLSNNGVKLQGIRETNLVEDMNSLPHFDLEEYYDLSNFYPPVHIRGNKVINLVSVRGCPYPCTFCAVAAINGTAFRKVSINRFVDNIQMYMKKGYDSFMIYDDTFTLDKNRAVEFSKEIIKRKLNILWNCWSRVDRVDNNTLGYMREAGCYLITFGCESFNEKTLKKLKKGYSVEQNFKGIEITKQNGMLASSGFMVGLPGETRDDIMHTIKMVPKTGLDFAFFPIYEPYQGTPLYDDCQKEGKWIIDKRFKNSLLVDQLEVWQSNLVKREEVERLSALGFKNFYFTPSYLFKLTKVLRKLPLERKVRMLKTGFDYFLKKPLNFNKKIKRETHQWL